MNGQPPRNFYLEDIPMEEARAALMTALAACGKDRTLPAEAVPLAAAVGRITAEPVVARISSPHYHAAAMDGYAVRAVDTFSATETRPLLLTHEQAVAVNTGAPLPAGQDAVIMIEHVQETAEGIMIYAPVVPWQHVRMMGEDMVATELVLPANHCIRPVDLGAIAGCGYHSVSVRRKPLVVLIPTGNELVIPGTEPRAGQVIESNSLILAAQIEQAGGTAYTLPIVGDDEQSLTAALHQALIQQPDLVLILSGSSAGSHDFTAAVIRKNGELLVHGVAVRPGHPVIFGMLETCPVIGVPGYPVSAALTGELFVEPLLAHWLGQSSAMAQRPRLHAQMTRKLNSPAGDDDFVRVTVARVGERWLATPLSKGAGVITSLVRADALAHIPRFSEGVDAGQDVELLLYRSVLELKAAMAAVGSHDPMLDLLAQHLAMGFPGRRLHSANVGSMGGLVALRRGEAHLAGVHLLDEASGEYNVSYVQKYLPDVGVQLVTFAHREQGLIVAKKNPLAIGNLSDLARVRYVNRQRGAGTRILLDYQLGVQGIDPRMIQGYEREEYTHLAVAAAIASGSADCGMGVRSAALALDLDFVPVGRERYDFVIPYAYREHIQPLLDTLQTAAFRDELAAQPGYDISAIGTVQYDTGA